ncbi:hypothetical protein ACS52_23830 [Bacillus cereus]|nr:hypothetical protein ACS52_23830 [Bacillus cereus]
MHKIVVLYALHELFDSSKDDNITGQTISEFHEEQKVLVSEDEDGDRKKKK